MSSMSRHDIRFMIYLGVTIAALILMVVGGICYRVNSWLLVGLMMISMLPLLWFVLSPYFTPRWVKQVQASGVRAAAEVLSGCGLESIGSRGSDMWLEVPVQVHPQNGEPFRARLKIRLSEAMLRELSQGMKVRVRYDPHDQSKVVLDGRLLPPASRWST